VASDDDIRIAAIQATPVFMDLDATIDKACALIAEAGREGASLAVFPEAFVPGYPLWAWFIPASRTHPLRQLYALLHRNSVAIPGPATDRLCAAAAEASVTVAIGVNERNAEASGGTLLNTLLWIGADGRILGRHRKLMPTAGEKLVWGFGDGSDLDVHDVGFARVGGLICWENYMPLARFALYASGVQLYAAPTWDRDEPWLSSMRHIAKEGRCVVIGCASPFHKDDVPDDLDFKSDFLSGVEGWINTGDSVIVDPDGKLIAGPAREEETILYGDIRPDQLIGPRWQLDTAGHYGRPDVFRLVHDRRPKPHLLSVDAADDQSADGPSDEDGAP
jgi:nitrilase